MKKIVLLALLCFSVIPVWSQVKKVAITDIIDKANSIDYGQKFLLRSCLLEAVNQTDGFEAYDRSDFLQVANAEADFQRDGTLSESQIKLIGQREGVQYIMVAEAASLGGGLNDKSYIISAKILDVTSAKVVGSANEICSLDPQDLRQKCYGIAKKMLDIKPKNTNGASSQTGSTSTSSFVDLGLSVKWAACNVGAFSPEQYGNYFTFGELSAIKSGRRRCPTDAEWTELRVNCNWVWTIQNGVQGYKVTSPYTGYSIFLPASGYRNDGSFSNVGSSGCYWSSTSYGYSDAWFVDFYSSAVSRRYYPCSYGFSVRPIMTQE